MATIGEVEAVLNEIAPSAYAQEWDNVGLLAGDRAERCRGALCCIDLSDAVLDEAKQARANLLVCYHPPILRPIRRLRADGVGGESLMWRAARMGCAIYSMHTALDAAAGGTNDVLAGVCGLLDVRPLDFVQTGRPHCKVVVFCPMDTEDDVAEAMFAAGAGWIGAYHHCSFRAGGQGTFWGTEASSPHLGKAGRLQRVEEIRLEAVCPQALVPEVVEAIRAKHPYEEPAFDIYPLQAEPASVGMGRIGKLPRPVTVRALARRLAKAVGIERAIIAGDVDRKVQDVAVCAGSAGKWALQQWRFEQADVLVTGELKHHDALGYVVGGKSVISLGHWPSERPVLGVLAERIRSHLPKLLVQVSSADHDVWQPA